MVAGALVGLVHSTFRICRCNIQIFWQSIVIMESYFIHSRNRMTFCLPKQYWGRTEGAGVGL